MGPGRFGARSVGEAGAGYKSCRVNAADFLCRGVVKTLFRFAKTPAPLAKRTGGFCKTEEGWERGGFAAELGDGRWEMGKECHWSIVIGGECRMEGRLGHRIETLQCRIIQEND
jgi:hypothetical protein